MYTIKNVVTDNSGIANPIIEFYIMDIGNTIIIKITAIINIQPITSFIFWFDNESFSNLDSYKLIDPFGYSFLYNEYYYYFFSSSFCNIN